MGLPEAKLDTQRRTHRCGLTKAPALLLALLVALAVACSGGDDAASEIPAASVDATPTLDGLSFNRPQQRNGIGDVDRAFDRYETTRADLIAKFKVQPWFQDGLDRAESLFVERGLAFAATGNGVRRANIRDETIERKLIKYEKFELHSRELELLLIYEPGQDGDKQFALMKPMVETLESIVGVQYPESVMTIVNGAFEINDFSDGQFIRIARCCVVSQFILAHELAHTYWSMAPSWFNEGMADIYAVFTLERLNKERPPGWTPVPADIESHFSSRKARVERLPEMLLTRRYASDGLYEAADVFLLEIRKQIGDEAFKAAAHDIYALSDYGRVNLREKRLEDVFLQYANSDAKRDAVSQLFNRQIWGDNGERYRELQELAGE